MCDVMNCKRPLPALRHLLTASGTAALGGSIILIKPTKHKFSRGKLHGSSVWNSNPSGKSSARLNKFKKVQTYVGLLKKAGGKYIPIYAKKYTTSLVE